MKLSDEIHYYYPKAPPTWDGITLRHLLSHTSGLIREAPAFDGTEIKPDSVSPIVLKDGSSHPYGFGWEIDTSQGAARMHHGGSLPGFRSEYTRFPQTGLSVIVLTNSDNAKPGIIAQEIASLYLSELGGETQKGRK